ncbi:MAG: N-acetylmuramoyl-L-alanine amidase [Candidatus Hydrogenedentes bacterium]|nr:N-acetylmuramoyl-L-alanine amidase [Candidatus Hydrogenedentota bacterium]
MKRGTTIHLDATPPWRLGLCLAVLLVCAGASASGMIRGTIEPGVVAVLKGGRQIFLEIRPASPQAARDLFMKALGDEALYARYKDRHAAAIPYAQLRPVVQRRVLEALFPEDYVDESGWWHVVTVAGADGMESRWALAEWVTGNGTNYKLISDQPENQQSANNLTKGQRILIPRNLLLEPMRTISKRKPPPPAPAPKPSPTPAPATSAPKAAKTSPPVEAPPVVADAAPAPLQPSEPDETDGTADMESDLSPAVLLSAIDPGSDSANGELEFGKDSEGGYAAYIIQKGEALYSSVVVRFTDFRENSDILSACATIQERSGIKDVRDIDAGRRILIPLDLLADQYQPRGTEQRQEYERGIEEARRLQQQRIRTKDLDGVVVVLDPGHGGRDHGAAVAAKGLYEDELTYDVVCRVKAILETTTRAKIHVTMLDPDQQYRVSNARQFTHDTDEVLLTSPIYENTDAKVSVNLRWYLANSIYRAERARGVDERKIVFVSVHCDALFNSHLRGAMVYIPGAAYRRASEQPSGAVYARYDQAREQRTVETTAAARQRDEALSRNFAALVLSSMQKNNPPLKVHDAGAPIRNVIRQSGGRAYVPAVLRNTQIPTKVLIETANLTNPTDCERLADPQWRQWMAESIVAALKAQFE